jgi:hypothetical protein
MSSLLFLSLCSNSSVVYNRSNYLTVILFLRPKSVLNLLWQIFRLWHLSEITVSNCPSLSMLLKERETIDALSQLPPETLLCRWLNFKLREANCNVLINNFQSENLVSFSSYHPSICLSFSAAESLSLLPI